MEKEYLDNVANHIRCATYLGIKPKDIEKIETSFPDKTPEGYRLLDVKVSYNLKKSIATILKLQYQLEENSSSESISYTCRVAIQSEYKMFMNTLQPKVSASLKDKKLIFLRGWRIAYECKEDIEALKKAKATLAIVGKTLKEMESPLYGTKHKQKPDPVN